MGKPSSSCLKIIACGSDSPVEDDIQTPEAKESGEKRGWSFRKRSARQRVLSNSVTTENLTLGNKEVPESTSISSKTPADTAVPEKVAALEQPDEKCQPLSSGEVYPAKFIEPEFSGTLGAAKPPKSVQLGISETLRALKPQEPVEAEVSEAVHASDSPRLPEPKSNESAFASEVIPTVAAPAFEPPVPTESKTSEGVVTPEPPTSSIPKLSEFEVALQDNILEEPMIVDIQTADSGILAEQELVKQRSIVKLQAAVRGHLVRRQAVDTLYCMQGIVKVQSLVRSRHSKLSADEILVNKPITSYSSTEKLLNNAFARQLLESMPKSKSTVIKCDPLNPTPTWLWLERWMALYSYGIGKLEKLEIRAENGQTEAGRVVSSVESENLSKDRSDSTNLEFVVKKASNTFENGKSSISLDQEEEYQTSNFLSNKEKMEQLPYDNSDASFEGPLRMTKRRNQSNRSSSHSQTQSGSLSNDLAVETEDLKFSMKSMASEQVEVESKKFAPGSRKRSNPSILAAQSKFQELSSSANYSGSLSSSHQVSSAEYHHLDTASFREESVIKEKDPVGAEALVLDERRFNMGGSEHGTELSVTSALDSPYLSEAEAADVSSEAKYIEERSSIPFSNESLEVKVKGSSSVHALDSSSSLVQKEFHESSVPAVAAGSHQAKQKPEPFASDEQDNGEYVALENAADSLQMEQKSERSTSDVQMGTVPRTKELARKSSPGASPKNSHRSPSSQVSGKVKRSKVDKSGSNTKQSSLSAGKRTPPPKPHDDSGVSSVEQLSKDQKGERRRNSFGSAKSENDEEPRDSTSSTKTIPSYMQATKSARAKANSPRSSPDVQDKDTFMIKKRHSLPGAGGRQGSPRVQRPTSQAPQSQPVKENANTPPQERRWVR